MTLRRPNVHRVLKMERGPGLADVLREGIDIQTVTRPTRIENLWIISSGRVPPNPSELLGSPSLDEFLRTHYTRLTPEMMDGILRHIEEDIARDYGAKVHVEDHLLHTPCLFRALTRQ